MNSRDKDLLIEIRVDTRDGWEGSTGYPVARDRILTARHGLYPRDRPPDAKIRLRWFHQQGELAKFVTLPHSSIIWEDAGLDVALIHCPFPANLTDWRRLSPLRPLHDERWASEGFPLGADTPDGVQEFPVAGQTHSAASQARRCHLGLDDTFRAPEDWGGISGAPVFVDRLGSEVVGVIVVTPMAAEARLMATLSADLFDAPGFKEAIGYDRDDARIIEPAPPCPRSLPAYAADEQVYLSHDMPLDAALVWGLARGAFTGLWGGRADADLVAELRRTEGLLQYLAPGRFMAREWLGVDLTRDPAPEETLSGLRWKSQAMAGPWLPGLVLRTHTMDPTLLNILRDCGGRLRERVFSGQPLALILDTTAAIASEPKLRDALADPGEPIEVLIAVRDWRGTGGEEPEAALVKQRLPRGGALRAWIDGIEEAIAKVSDAGLPGVLAIARDRLPPGDADRGGGPDAGELVSDLDALEDSQLDKWMLLAVDQYWSDRIGPLVRAFAQSRRLQARSLALTLACSDAKARERQTVWLRAWAAGASRLTESDLVKALKAISIGYADLQRDLMLAALFQALQYPLDTRRRQLFDSVRETLSTERDLDDLCGDCENGRIEFTRVRKLWSDQHFAWALRAGVKVEVRSGDLGDLSLERPDAWWMLTALSPTLDMVEAIAALDRNRRAVFGLISSQECGELARDHYLLKSIVECRRGRALR